VRARAEADSAPLTQDAVQLGAVAVYHPVHQRAQLGERRRGAHPVPCHVRPCLFHVGASCFVCSLARARRHPGAWAPLRSPGACGRSGGTSARRSSGASSSSACSRVRRPCGRRSMHAHASHPLRSRVGGRGRARRLRVPHQQGVLPGPAPARLAQAGAPRACLLPCLSAPVSCALPPILGDQAGRPWKGDAVNACAAPALLATVAPVGAGGTAACDAEARDTVSTVHLAPLCRLGGRAALQVAL